MGLFKPILARIEYHDNHSILRMHTTKHVGLSNSWEEASAVKLVEKNIDYHIVNDKLKKSSKIIAGLEKMDIGNVYFMVNSNDDTY